jgi:beta-lactamase regulating signal transducer with metallopeptidase domain
MNIVLEQINTAGRVFVDFAWSMLLQSSVLIAILLLVDYLLRRRVRAVFRYWLWMLVVIKLVLPTSLSSPVSIGRFMEQPMAAIDIAENNQPVAGDISNVPSQSPGAEGMVESRLDSLPAASIHNPPVAPAVSLAWQGGVLLVWSAVAIAMLLLLLQRAIFVWGLVRQAKEANDLMKDMLNFCCKTMGVRGRVGLKVSPNATSPAVCGLFRPVILLPHGLGSNLGSGPFRVVLMHELAHIKREDLWINLVQTVLQIAYFYNPLLWLANWAIRRVREQAVDEAVQVALGEKALQYPETLLNVARLAFKRPALSLRLVGVVESKSALAGRIKRMLTRPVPKTTKLGIIGSLAIILFAAVLLPMAKAKDAGRVDNYASVTVQEGIGFDGLIVGDPNCTGEFIKSKLGEPDEEIKNEQQGWWIDYHKKYGLDFWLNLMKRPDLRENTLYEIRLNKGFRGKLASGISMSSTKQDVFKTYGNPIREAIVDDLKKQFDYRVLFIRKADGIARINYDEKGVLFWFDGDKIYQIRVGVVSVPDGNKKYAGIDVCVEDFDIRQYPEGGLYTVSVSIRNKGGAESPKFGVYFYRGDPNETKPMTHEAGPIKPGDVWCEGSMPFALKEGTNEISVALDPTNQISESSKTNNEASMKVVVKDGKIVEKKVFPSSAARRGVVGIGPGWQKLQRVIGDNYRGSIGGYSNDEQKCAEYFEKVLSWARPGDTFVMMFAFDEEKFGHSQIVPKEYQDLLPKPWKEIKEQIERGEAVELKGKARGFDTIVLAAPTLDQLNELIQSTELLQPFKAPAGQGDAASEPGIKTDVQVELAQPVISAAEFGDTNGANVGKENRMNKPEKKGPPVVVKTTPVTYANDVSPDLNNLTVTFNQRMADKSWAWVQLDAPYPETVGQPYYDSEMRTCTLPVKLEPGQAYLVAFNVEPYIGFVNTAGEPAKPYVLVFATKNKDGKPTPIPENLIAKAKSVNERAREASSEPGKETGEAESVPYAQVTYDEIRPDGTILFKNTIREINKSGKEVTSKNFINSDFVQVRAMTDSDGRELKFKSIHDGDIYRYEVIFNKPIPPGGLIEYTSEGTMDGLVKPVSGSKDTFEYYMQHWPAAGQPTQRVETYLLPAGAKLISTTPADMERKEKDGRIELHVEKMIPPGGSITTSFRYRMPEG